MRPWDVIVVGGGIGGLAGAALLAHAGRKVLVLERRPVLGGRAMVVRQGGFTLNYGYHFVMGGPHSPHWRVLRRIGRTVPARAVHVSRFYQERYGGFHRFPAPPLELWRTGLFPWAARIDYARSSLAMLRDKPADWGGVTLSEYLERKVRTPEARLFDLDLARAVCFDPEPERLSAGHWLELFQLTARTGVHPSLILPWDRMFDAFAETVRAAGGEVRLKARVDRVELDGDRVSGIRAGGERLTAGAYLVTVPAQELPAMLPDGFPGWTPRRMQAVAPTCGLSLDLGLEGDWHRYGAVDVPEENIVIACHSLWVPDLAPQGHTLLQVLKFMTPEQVRDGDYVAAARQRMLAAVGRHYPGALERVALTRWLVRPILTGARRRADQPWQGLLPVVPEGVRNLYFAGDTAAAPGPLSNAAVAAAEQAAAAILARHPAGDPDLAP